MANKKYSLLLSCVALLVATSAAQNIRKREQFKVLYEWNHLNFAWPSADAEREAVTAGHYVKENVIVTGIRQFGDRLYLTLPRFKGGVPATVASVPATADLNGNNTSPVLTPFPSWAMNEIGKCNSFQSVQSMEIDRNGVMWIVDTGRTSTMNPASAPAGCPPTLTLLNIADPTKAVRYSFPESVASNRSYLGDIVVDDTAGMYAYITDNSASDPGIIVFSLGENRSWKLRDAKSMKAVPVASNFTLNGTSVNLQINVDGIALGPRFVRPDGVIDRRVFYSPLASYRMYSVLASSLQNEPVSQQTDVSLHITDLGVKSSQSDGMTADDLGLLYFGAVGNYSIVEWDSRTDFVSNQHIIAKDPNYIQWAGRFAFDDKGHLLTVINRFHNFVAGKVDPGVVNYRILKAFTGGKQYLAGPTFEDITKELAKPKVSNKPATQTVTVTGAAAAKSPSGAGAARPGAGLLLLLLAGAALLLN